MSKLFRFPDSRMRHVKLVPGRPIHAAALLQLVTTAYADMKGRLEAGQRGTAGQFPG